MRHSVHDKPNLIKQIRGSFSFFAFPSSRANQSLGIIKNKNKNKKLNQNKTVVYLEDP